MPVKLKWPWLGIAIPAFLISFLGYGGHYFVLQNFCAIPVQLSFEACLTMIWISYYLAIFTDTGSPPAEVSPQAHGWKFYCKICKCYKPERTHHCKTCGKCVLVMDHHCPWTMNCVGLNNFAPFVRFLVWVMVTTSFLGFQLIRRALFHWHGRHDRYFVFKSELWFLVLLIPLNFFVLLSIAALFIRCAGNQFFKGMTQIETWEFERLENLFDNRKLVPQLVISLKEIYQDENIPEQEVSALSTDRSLDIEELINFPYDNGIMSNIKLFLGSFTQWVLPWGATSQNGLTFEKNEFSHYNSKAPLIDRFLSLPWPPDGGRHKNAIDVENDNAVDIGYEGGEAVIRKRFVDPRTNLRRTEWFNEWGENLADFGVDVEAESPD
ncbi:LAMI_0B07712g1_1 [Lachancea mirantina]|uniref:Palmitoyltransferase n=1 Tax=Lachancea mirantina TaxID=1230905 RepID=A0A1G4IXS6_9SACH|nr:LAMI_0B07712g1_1 [Lachancea mirantina]